MSARQSNIELLRIIAMLMILVVHFDGACLGLPSPQMALSSSEWAKTVVESLSIIGVNLFVLISGYFGIRTDSRRILTYLGMCAFYSLGIFSLACIAKPSIFSLEALADAALFISHNDLWFVRDYFFLMLLAPFVNVVFANISKWQLHWLTAAILLISCYFGWLWQGKVNPTGYSLMQLVTIYVVGHWLSLNRLSRSKGAALYVFSTICIVLSAAELIPTMAYAYNSPFVIASAVGLFVVFSSFPFSNAYVNFFASGTFAVYLIHKNPYVWGGWLKPQVLALYGSLSPTAFALCISAFTLSVFFSCILIDKLRQYAVGYLSRLFFKRSRMA